MKTLRLVATMLAATLLLSSVLTAQGHANPPKPSHDHKAHVTQKPSKAPKLFACDKCEAASTKGGKCTGCGQAMRAINGSYVFGCADCHTESAKPGKCAKCGAKMEKMAMTYACEMCHVTSAKGGKCPKCGMAMKKHTMKLMPKG